VELAHYVRELQNRDYLYGGYIAPHDAQAKELGTGKSRIELMQSLGRPGLNTSPTSGNASAPQNDNSVMLPITSTFRSPYTLAQHR
jgi:hypothetical protein